MMGSVLERLAARIDRIDGRRWPRLVYWSYLVRPYDGTADARRWCWQRPTPCRRVAAAVDLTYCVECERPVLVMRGQAAPAACTGHVPIIEPDVVDPDHEPVEDVLGPEADPGPVTR